MRPALPSVLFLATRFMLSLPHTWPAFDDTWREFGVPALQILAGATSCKELDLSVNNTFSAEIWHVLNFENLPALTALSLSLSRSVFPEDNAHLVGGQEGFEHLQSVTVRSLCSLTTLAELDLAGTNVTDEVLAGAHALERLTCLCLLDCATLTASSLVSIGRLACLQELAMSFVQLQGRTAPLAHCTSLVRLRLLSCGLRTQDLQFVRQFQRLRVLSVCDSDIVPANWNAAPLRNLLDSEVWGMLAGCHALRCVHVALELGEDEAFAEQAQLLTSLRRLRELVVSGTSPSCLASTAAMARAYRQLWVQAGCAWEPIAFGYHHAYCQATRLPHQTM